MVDAAAKFVEAEIVPNIIPNGPKAILDVSFFRKVFYHLCKIFFKGTLSWKASC